MAAGTTSLVVFACYLLAATLASWRWFWARHAKPRERGKVALGVVGMAVIAAMPLLAAALSLQDGRMPCRGSRCPALGSGLADSPVAFWIQVGMVGAVAALFLGGMLFGIGWLVRSIAVRRP